MTPPIEQCHRCFGRGYLGGSFRTCSRCGGSGSRPVGSWNPDPWGWDPVRRVVTYNGAACTDEHGREIPGVVPR